jgi:signal transduction histidine kinase
MGLQIMQDRVDALEGELRLASDTNGTCVSVTLPMNQAVTT